MKRPRAAAVALAAAGLALLSSLAAAVAQPSNDAAWFERSLQNAAERRESRPDILDTPVLPGSIMKAVTLAAALESRIIEPETARMCRRVITVDGQRYICSHPDLKRPLTPAEALAHSCNDFFVSLAARLPRPMLNDLRVRLGLPPLPTTANYAAALVGLDGPRVTPRALLDVLVRLALDDRDRPVALAPSTRQVLLDGLRGAVTYGSASELAARRVSAMGKTGTASMPGGGVLGMVALLAPAERPTRALIVVAPGVAGRDATSIAGDLLTTPATRPRPATPTRPAATASAPAPTPAPPSTTSTSVRVGMTQPDGRTRVETLALEDYVARVLAGEGQPRAGDAAQQALAIAIRTFALANRNRHRREGFDLCDTTHCQVLRAATATTRRAAESTAGRVLMHQSQPAIVFYSAWCGGRSELPSQVWPGAIDYAFEPAQADDACREESEWSSEIHARDIERALRAAGLRGDRLRSLRVIARSASRRVTRLRAEGFQPAEVAGDDFRMAIGRVLGWQRLKSTMFELRHVSNGYVFTGRGFGHGVGLCVIGAGARAARGDSADQILRFYYPGLRVESMTPAALTTSAAAPLTPSPAPANRAADVLLALPAGEEGERGDVLQLVRKARDEIAAAAGVGAPAAIRITVHSSVESFARATGQPWWTSGATEQSSIDLLPLSMLQQRGLFERTIRHEVAHVVIDAALAGRPIWVREGAAAYFASPGAASARTGRVRCPADDEFLRPLSAGAHRDAYARAEACFRRQVGDGRAWRDVR